MKMSWSKLVKRVAVLAVALAAGFAANALQAAVVAPSLPQGSQYRVVFTTNNLYASYNSTTPSTTRSIAYWDGIVAGESTLSTAPAISSATFHLVGSLFDGSTSTNAPSVANMAVADSIPVYNTNGVLVAANSSDFFSATHLAGMNFDRDGNTLTSNVWAGWTPTLPTFRPFGSAGQTFWTSNALTNPWVASNVLGATSLLRVLAISEPITLSVPEPASLGVIAAGASLLLVRRKR